MILALLPYLGLWLPAQLPVVTAAELSDPERAPIAAIDHDAEDQPEEPDEAVESTEEAPGGIRLARNVALHFEADLEVTHELAPNRSTYEMTFDEVHLALESGWWSAEAGLKYASEDAALRVEEGSVQLGPTDAIAGWLRAGRTVLPFAEMDGLFLSDPLVVALGETVEDALLLGAEGAGPVHVTAGIFEAAASDAGAVEGVAALALSITSELQLRLEWTSALERATELRDLRDERSTQPDPYLGWVARQGWSAHLELDAERWLGRAALAFANRAFPAGTLEERPQRPRAWGLDLGVALTPRTTLAARTEGARQLPDAPRFRYGLAATQHISRVLEVSAEALYAPGTGSTARERILGLQLSFSW